MLQYQFVNNKPDKREGGGSSFMKNLFAFIHELEWNMIPGDVRHQAKRCLLDTVGSALAGTRTELSRIIYDHVCSMYKGGGCRLWLDGRAVSPVGAALAHGMTIDSLDIHDNCSLVKGHSGVALVPTALAVLEHIREETVSGRELITAIVVGYEVATRAGKALHSTACDYHTSGTWNALGCAAVASRWLKLRREQIRHALGIAEYHGPRSPMMRCIDHPTMLKDGSGWGAMTGISAAFLAAGGFTGAPALTVESAEIEPIWSDLGATWLTRKQDFKKYAVCHWAQPAIAGVLELMSEHRLEVEDIRKIRILTFHEATRLNGRRPANTEQAQYCLPFPVAAALVHDRLGFDELNGNALTDPRILSLADRVELEEDDECNKHFPEIQTAKVRLELSDGRSLKSRTVLAPWDTAGVPATDEELQEKFRWLTSGVMETARARELEDILWRLDDLPRAVDVLPYLLPQ